MVWQFPVSPASWVQSLHLWLSHQDSEQLFSFYNFTFPSCDKLTKLLRRACVANRHHSTQEGPWERRSRVPLHHQNCLWVRHPERKVSSKRGRCRSFDSNTSCWLYRWGRFIEFGEYNGNLYGTSLESIRRILAQNKSCVVDVQPEVSDEQPSYQTSAPWWFDHFIWHATHSVYLADHLHFI